jgi:hypothetical protein
MHNNFIGVPKQFVEEWVAAANRLVVFDAVRHPVDVLLEKASDLRVVGFGQGVDAIGEQGDVASDLLMILKQEVENRTIFLESLLSRIVTFQSQRI